MDINAIRAKLAAQKAAQQSAPAVEQTAQPTIKQQLSQLATVADKPTANTIPSSATNTTEINTHELSAKLAELDDALKTSHPMMPVLLRDIHTALKKQPQNVTLLSEEEIRTIVSGLMKHTAITIATKKATSKKSTKSISIDDL